MHHQVFQANRLHCERALHTIISVGVYTSNVVCVFSAYPPNDYNDCVNIMDLRSTRSTPLDSVSARDLHQVQYMFHFARKNMRVKILIHTLFKYHYAM